MLFNSETVHTIDMNIVGSLTNQINEEISYALSIHKGKEKSKERNSKKWFFFIEFMQPFNFHPIIIDWVAIKSSIQWNFI